MAPSLDNSFHRRVRSGAEESQFNSLLEIVQADNNVEEGDVDDQENKSEDPFQIYKLLHKNNKVDRNEGVSDDSLKYPPGFTPHGSNGVDSSNVVGDNNATVKVERVNTIYEANEGSGGIRVNGISKANSAESGMSGHFKTYSLPRIGGSILGVLDEVVKVGQVMGYNMEGCKSNMADIIGSQGVEEGCLADDWAISSFDRGLRSSQGVSEKRLLWDYLQSEICKWNGEVVIMGDFNEVRYKSNRYGSKFNAHSAMVFNSFILNSGLVEVSLGGCSFTWCHKTAAKTSKLDRFLVSERFLNSCPNINAITLERYLSDHRPILLHDAHVDYGPTPFRFFHYLIEIEGFAKMIKYGWRDNPCDRSNVLRNLTGKLKYVKNDIRVWNKTKGNSNRDVKAQLKLELEVVDSCIDNDQKRDLEGEVTNDEIKKAVWDCGTDKAPGPDGFTFGFYRKF
nr:RNA-directed DNA polymerase, eukaryota [Tanacetum cinerariifolium]